MKMLKYFVCDPFCYCCCWLDWPCIAASIPKIVRAVT